MDDQIQKLKQRELELFRLFIQVCEKLDLRYYVVGGTLLGAVRHKGFIPWDDDIDVGLPRADYDRFVQQAQALLPDWCFLQNYHTDPAYPYLFSKLRDSRTTFIETALKDYPINHGLYIDVFPIEYVPEQGYRRFERKNFLLKIRANYGLNVKPSFKIRVLQRLTLLRWPRLQDALKQREALFRSVGRTGLMVNLCGAWGKREILPAEYFGEGTPQRFEDLTVRGPAEYDGYLKGIYGDYMRLPPPEKRVAHHACEVIDLERPYTFYAAQREKEMVRP